MIDELREAYQEALDRQPTLEEEWAMREFDRQLAARWRPLFDGPCGTALEFLANISKWYKAIDIKIPEQFIGATWEQSLALDMAKRFKDYRIRQVWLTRVVAPLLLGETEIPDALIPTEAFDLWL